MSSDNDWPSGNGPEEYDHFTPLLFNHMKLYYYRAKVRSVYDADSIRVDIDKGFNDWTMNMALRLYGIDAPELRGDELAAGRAARDYLRSRLPEGQEVIVETVKDRTGKYGRYLAIVWLETETGKINVNDDLVENGYAVEREY